MPPAPPTYIPPVGPGPADDQDLDVVFQRAIAGLTGLPGNMVRPRWQITPPTQPGPDVDWCAVGVLNQLPDRNAHLTYTGTTVVQRRHWTLEVQISFYGPHSSAYALRFQNGVLVPGNMDALRLDNIAYLESGDQALVPELINQQWYRRVDLQSAFRRQVTASYALNTILSAEVNIIPNQ